MMRSLTRRVSSIAAEGITNGCRKINGSVNRQETAIQGKTKPRFAPVAASDLPASINKRATAKLRTLAAAISAFGMLARSSIRGAAAICISWKRAKPYALQMRFCSIPMPAIKGISAAKITITCRNAEIKPIAANRNARTAAAIASLGSATGVCAESIDTDPDYLIDSVPCTCRKIK